MPLFRQPVQEEVVSYIDIRASGVFPRDRDMVSEGRAAFLSPCVTTFEILFVAAPRLGIYRHT